MANGKCSFSYKNYDESLVQMVSGMLIYEIKCRGKTENGKSKCRGKTGKIVFNAGVKRKMANKVAILPHFSQKVHIKRLK